MSSAETSFYIACSLSEDGSAVVVDRGPDGSVGIYVARKGSVYAHTRLSPGEAAALAECLDKVCHGR